MSLDKESRRRAWWRKAGRKYRRKHPERYRALSQRYRRANADQRRVSDRERSKAWRKANPEKRAARSAVDKARRRGAPGKGITREEWQTILADSLGLCAYCNTRKKLTLDHIDPLAQGGLHEPENSAPACSRCNSCKHDRPLLVWLAIRAQERAA